MLQLYDARMMCIVIDVCNAALVLPLGYALLCRVSAVSGLCDEAEDELQPLL